MARLPTKPVRFLVWLSASREHREDALIALDEGFDDAYERFGPRHAHVWSVSQAVRSLPYGLIISVIKMWAAIYALVS